MAAPQLLRLVYDPAERTTPRLEQVFKHVFDGQHQLSQKKPAEEAQQREPWTADSDDDDDDEAPRVPRKRKATTQTVAHRSKQAKNSSARSQDQDQDEVSGPLAPMDPAYRTYAPWYRATDVPPFVFTHRFDSSFILAMLRQRQQAAEAKGEDLAPFEFPVVFHPHIQHPDRARGSPEHRDLAVACPGLLDDNSDDLILLSFAPFTLDRNRPALPVPPQRPWPSSVNIELEALLNALRAAKNPHGSQGLFFAASMAFAPATAPRYVDEDDAPRLMEHGVVVSLTLTPLVNASFLGLASARPRKAGKPLSPAVRSAALSVLCPRPLRERYIYLTQRGRAAYRHDYQETSDEWFYSIIDAAPAHQVLLDRKGKGKETSSAAAATGLGQCIRPKGLKPTLLPFQSRSVGWLLSREGVQVDWASAQVGDGGEQQQKYHTVKPVSEEQRLEDLTSPDWDRVRFHGQLVPSEDRRQEDMDLTRYNTEQDSERLGPNEDQPALLGQDGFDLWINYLSGLVLAYRPLVNDSGNGFGMLCEEMGLGKTVEILSLILMHPEPERSTQPAFYDPSTGVNIQPSGVTLIVCPLAILQQWKSEIEKHAPGLRTLEYEGINSKSFQKQKLTAKQVAHDYDIMLCSFEVLGKEVVYARKPTDRALRGAKKYEPPRSLLVEIDFLRVCMDEVQMAAAPASGISETAALVRRKHSFAVSGTPIRGDLDDLAGLFKFLGFSLDSDNKAFKAFFKNPDILADVVHKIAIRTVKTKVEHELVLPGQDRFIVPLQFGPIERTSYRERYSDALVDLGMHRDGTAPSAWQPDRTTMATWIVRLRQLCCHMYPAGYTFGSSNNGIVRKETRRDPQKGPQTLNQVLHDMRSNVDSLLWSAVRGRFERIIKKAHFLARDKENCEGLEEGISLFKVCISELLSEIEKTREVLAHLREQPKDSANQSAVQSEDEISSSDDGTEDPGIAFNKAAGEKTHALARYGALRQHLRGLLLLVHTAYFWLGSCYFGVGTLPEEENKAYEDAEIVRKEILRPERRKAEAAIKALERKVSSQSVSFKESDFLLETRSSSRGIQSALILERIDETTDKINSVAVLLWEWRTRMTALMSGTLTAEEADEEDYARRAEQEEKLDIMLDLYRQVLSDYREALTGERDASADDASSQVVASIQLALREVAQQGKVEGPRRTVKTKRKKGKNGALSGIDLESLKSYGLGPGAVFYQELSDKRNEVLELEVSPLRTLCRDLHDLLESNLRREEETIVQGEWTRLRQALKYLSTAYERICNELTGTLQPTFRARNMFYKSLQAVSDTVVDIQIKPKSSFLKEIALLEQDKEHLDQEIRSALSKQRYLDFLDSDLTSMPEEDRSCTICGDPFYRGCFTICGHLFCTECFRRWLVKSFTCPTCKKRLRRDSYQTVIFEEEEPMDSEEASEDQISGIQAPKAVAGQNQEVIRQSTVLRTLTPAAVSTIEDMSTQTGLGKKLDTVIKHVRLLQNDDPGCKIVLSAWQQSLEACATALKWYGIKTVRLEKSGKKKGEAAVAFANDPEVSVFLLHTHSQAAGLNLTAARYVILFEPLVHPSVELQAVGRVHRIGQRQSTTVFQYTITDTVDERLAQYNADNGHRLFAMPNNSSTASGGSAGQEDLSRLVESVGGTAPPTVTAQKNSEEVLTTSNEDMARILFEEQELHTLQACLIEHAGRQAEQEMDRVMRNAS